MAMKSIIGRFQPGMIKQKTPAARGYRAPTVFGCGHVEIICQNSSYYEFISDLNFTPWIHYYKYIWTLIMNLSINLVLSRIF